MEESKVWKVSHSELTALWTPEMYKLSIIKEGRCVYCTAKDVEICGFSICAKMGDSHGYCIDECLDAFVKYDPDLLSKGYQATVHKLNDEKSHTCHITIQSLVAFLEGREEEWAVTSLTSLRERLKDKLGVIESLKKLRHKDSLIGDPYVSRVRYNGCPQFVCIACGGFVQWTSGCSLTACPCCENEGFRVKTCVNCLHTSVEGEPVPIEGSGPCNGAMCLENLMKCCSERTPLPHSMP